MPVYDTGPIDNRSTPRTTQLTIRVFNTGRLSALVGIETYFIQPPGDGLGSNTIYGLQLVNLSPFNTPGASFTMDNVYADLDVFGVRVITSGLGANDIAITVLEKTTDGEIIKEHVLGGELSRIDELLLAYIPDDGDRINIVEIGTKTEFPQITLTPGTDSVAVDITPDGTRAYFADEFDSVTVVDTATNTVLTTIPLGIGDSQVRNIAITPDGLKAYVTNGDFDSVTVIDTTTNTIMSNILLPLGSGPRAVAITPDGSLAYVANNGDSITIIDTTTDAIVNTILMPIGSFPISIAITPDGTRAYVANFVGSVSIILLPANVVFTTIPVGINVRDIAISPDGSKAYITTNIDVRVINTRIQDIMVTIPLPVGSSPLGLAVTPDGSRVYVAALGENNLLEIDTNSNTVTAILSTGFGPRDVAITPILLF